MAFKKFGAPDDAHLSFVQPEASPAPRDLDAENRLRDLRDAALLRSAQDRDVAKAQAAAKEAKGK